MFNDKLTKHKRLKSEDVLRYSGKDYVVDEKAFNILNSIFDWDYDVDQWQEFLSAYEFLYDKKREYLILIIRNVRLRVRKYFYLPPIYILFELKNGKCFNVEPQKLRYFQKLQFHSLGIDASDEEAYELMENPYQIAYHPHIDSKGYACLGHWGENLNTAKDEGPYAYVETLRGYLNDYNGRSTFFRVDPYSFDRKTNRNTGTFFPCTQDTLIYVGYPKYAKTADELLMKEISKDWMIDMCQKQELNFAVWNKIWFYLISEPIEEERTYNDYIRFVISVLMDENIECPFTDPLEYPRYRADGDDEEEYAEFTKRKEEWEDYKEFFKTYDTNTLTIHIYKYLYTLFGYELSIGELNCYLGAMYNYEINFEYDKDKYEKISALKRTGFSLFKLLSPSNNNNINKFISLITLIKTKSYTLYRDQFINWGLAMNKRNPNNKLRELYAYLNKSMEINYSRFNEEKLLHGSIEIGDESVFIDDLRFRWTHEFKLFFFYKRMVKRIMHEVSRSCENDSGFYTDKEADLFRENVLNNIDWNKKLKKIKLSKKKMFAKAMNDVFKNQGLAITSSINKVALHDIIIKMAEKEENKEYYDDIDYYYNALLNGEGADTDILAAGCRIVFNKCFPQFPTELINIKEFFYQVDKKILTYGYRQQLDSLNKKVKELNNVLKSSISDIQQSELFPEEISIN